MIFREMNAWMENDVILGINIDISHFQLISHRALGPVPTEVKEMPWAFLTDSLEW